MHKSKHSDMFVNFGAPQAVVLYHVHEYAHALSVLEKLFQNIEPVDEVFLSLYSSYVFIW